MATNPLIPSLGPGAILGHFEIVRAIGAGGMGTVFEARDIRLDRRIALKVLSRDLFRDEIARRRFFREAQLAGSINHPNVAMIHEVDEDDGAPFIAMELVSGSNMRTLLFDRGGALPIPEVVSIGGQVCGALEAAHRLGVVHRDIKSSNIMVTPEGQTKVLDFGLAKALAREPSQDRTPIRSISTATELEGQSSTGGSALGTPSYMSPEQADGHIADSRSDIFSLGVVLYEAASGTLPFKGSSAGEVLNAIRSEDPTPLHVSRSEIPQPFSRIIEKCLAKDPDERYASAAELALDLEAVQRPPRLRRRTPLGGSLRLRNVMLAMVLLAGVSLAWLIPQWRSPIAPPAPHLVDLVAVLPFENVSDDANESYLAAAVPIELTSRLGQISTVKVVPWTFMRQFQSTMSLQQIRDSTGADAVLEGTVQLVPAQRENESRRVRISARLFEAETGEMLWSEEFEQSLGSFLAIEAEMARKIAGQVQGELSHREQSQLGQARLTTQEAMALYLQGRELVDERSEARLRRAFDFFRSTVDSDPGFAEAYVGLAETYALMTSHFDAMEPSEAYAHAVEATAMAISIDPNLADAWAVQAFARFLLGWDWQAANEEFERALELAPSSATVRHWYANYLTAVGRHEEAIAESHALREQAPLSPVFNRRLGWSYFFARRYDEAVVYLKQTLALDPDFVPARTLLGRALVQLGDYDQAIAELRDVDKPLMLGQAYAAAGRIEEAKRILEEHAFDSDERVSAFKIALIHTTLGERDEAIRWLERAFEQRDPRMIQLKTHPMLDPVREDPRFQNLLDRMAFPS